MPPLSNIRHEIFCNEYIVDLNASRAYKRVYTEVDDNTARANSSRLLTDANIITRIEELKQIRLNRVQITQDEVLEELRLLLKSNINNYEVDLSGKVVLKDNVSPSEMRAVSSLKKKTRKLRGGVSKFNLTGDPINPNSPNSDDSDSVEVEEVELRLWPKDRAVELAMKHTGLIGNDKLEVSLNSHSKEMVQRIISTAFDFCPEDRKIELGEKLQEITLEYKL